MFMFRNSLEKIFNIAVSIYNHNICKEEKLFCFYMTNSCYASLETGANIVDDI